jgi:hypothetical protein
MAQGIKLKEIDSALAAWNDRLGAAAQNLLDLQDEPTYQQLTGSGGMQKSPVTGVTASTVEPALGAVLTVFQHFGLLKETIDRARVLRADLPAPFLRDQKLRDIEDLLFGKSIHLPPVDVPLEQRTLLSAVRNVECISPDDLLETMVRAFQAAKDGVIAVDKAWKDLDLILSRINSRIEGLHARIALLGPESVAELDSAERLLEQMHARVKNDPLGASADIDTRIGPVLTRLEAALVAKDQLNREIGDGISTAHSLLDTLTHLNRDAVAAATQVRQKVADSIGLPSPLPSEKIDGLREWLNRLEKKYADGMLDPVAVGLRNWNMAAQDYVSIDKAALSANRAPLEARNELRGRFDALKAKARAYGVAENHPQIELAKQAEALLFGGPTALDRAAAAVAAYGKSLNSSTSGGILPE